MFLLVTALYAEAHKFIEKLRMKPVGTYTRLRVFEGILGEEPVRLLLTGVGKLSACGAVTEYLSLCSQRERSQLYLVNIGAAALDGEEGKSGESALGRVSMAVRVLDEGSGRRFYPDIHPHPFLELPLITVERVLRERHSGLLHMADMEASGICEAVSRFLTWDRVAFLKCLSDRAEGVKPDREKLETLMEGASASILEWLGAESARLGPGFLETERLLEKREKLREAWGLILNKRPVTVAMGHRLEQLLNAWACLGETSCRRALELLEDYGKAAHSSVKREEKAAFLKLCGQLEEALESELEKTQESESRPEKEKTGRLSAGNSVYRRGFSHVYVEEGLEREQAERVLSRLPGACVIPIRHFKDVFNRGHQNFQEQKQNPALILAKKTDHFLYPGAPVCQRFGHQHFYYASLLMNCLYDCEYCYLQGMYPGGYMAAFLNLEDYFSEVEKLLLKHPVYLCISFDTDLLAMEAVLGFGKRWCAFAASHRALTIEIRTKGDGAFFLKEMEGSAPENVILAWTLSPRTVIERFEHRTAALEQRLSSMRRAMDMGFHVRACFDPAILIPDFQEEYAGLIREVFEYLPPDRLYDASIGTFRISREYLKNMRRSRPGCCIVQYPYVSEGGVACYGEEKSREMMEFLKEELLKYLPEEKLFLWEM